MVARVRSAAGLLVVLLVVLLASPAPTIDATSAPVATDDLTETVVSSDTSAHHHHAQPAKADRSRWSTASFAMRTVLALLPVAAIAAAVRVVVRRRSPDRTPRPTWSLASVIVTRGPPVLLSA